MKKYTNRIKLMPKFTKCMSLAMILTFTSYEEAFAEMSYAEQTSFTVSMENQTLKSVINWVEKNSQFIFIYRTDIDLSRRVNVDVRNKTIEEVLKQMFAGTDLEYHIRDRQVIIRKAISREETRPIVMQQDKVTVKGIVTDAKGEAIIGANIIEKGTTNGTITDIDGQFTLMVSEKASLVFSYIGYLTHPQKNLIYLIDEFERFHTTHSDYSLVFAGPKGKHAEQILTRAARLGSNFHYLGKVDYEDLQYLYSACEVFCFPSLYEGFGMPVLEAMACGAPVITSNRSSLPEILPDAEWLIDPEKTYDLSVRLSDIVGCSRTEISKKNIDYAKNFSWRKHGERLKTIIKQYI